MTAYGAILASGPRKVLVIVPPDDTTAGDAGVALDLATGELVPLATHGGTTWHVLTPLSFRDKGRTLHAALGDEIRWIME